MMVEHRQKLVKKPRLEINEQYRVVQAKKSLNLKLLNNCSFSVANSIKVCFSGFKSDGNF